MIQAIHIEGRNIEDIIRLRCVKSCEKTSVAGIMRYRFYPQMMAHPAPLQSAYTGDWLCEDIDHKWHILNDDTYNKRYGDNKTDDKAGHAERS